MSDWRVGNHYGIHVYEGNRPVATFHNAEDAQLAVAAVNALPPARQETERLRESVAHFKARLASGDRWAGVAATAVAERDASRAALARTREAIEALCDKATTQSANGETEMVALWPQQVRAALNPPPDPAMED